MFWNVLGIFGMFPIVVFAVLGFPELPQVMAAFPLFLKGCFDV